MPLRGVLFEDLDKLKMVVVTELHRITLSFLARGITYLPTQWNNIIQQRGQYFEGLLIIYFPIYYRLFVIKPLSLLIITDPCR